jgi:His/Glu/Gln/Arg/opine family amino acid ABC transporter permease subunit
MDFSIHDIFDFAPDLFKGAVVTVQITLVSMLFALVIGLAVACIRSSKIAALKAPAILFVDVFRGTPLILQIFYIYYVLPLAGFALDAFTAGVIALSLNYGAYLSEVFRSGIVGVAAGQREAAWSLGLPERQIMTLIILPQAIRAVIPAAANYFIALFKDSALVSVIAITELLRAGQLLAASTYKVFEIYTLVALMYLGISYPASWFTAWLESHFRIGKPPKPRKSARTPIAAAIEPSQP